MKEELNLKVKRINREERGITLIALVITIIVLLILAAISITMLTGDNSILKRATDAKIETEKGQEKEIVALAYNSALAKKASNGDTSTVTAEDLNTELTNQGATADGDTPIIITFQDSKNNYIIDSKGNVGDYVPPALAVDKLIINLSENEDTKKSPYVNYIDKNGNKILCRVLYGANEQSGIELISVNPVALVKLGHDDMKVKDSDFKYSGKGKINSSGKKCSASYNRAVTTLNEKAEEYINPEFSDKARCVGSNPQNPKDITVTAFTGKYEYMKTYNYNNKFKVKDLNYKNDYTRLDEIGARNFTDESISSYYWLASRRINESSFETEFCILFIDKSGVFNWKQLVWIKSDGNLNGGGVGYGLRPVFHLKSGVKISGGDGTIVSPYTLSI